MNRHKEADVEMQTPLFKMCEAVCEFVADSMDALERPYVAIVCYEVDIEGNQGTSFACNTNIPVEDLKRTFDYIIARLSKDSQQQN